MEHNKRPSSVSVGIRHTLISHQNDEPLIVKKDQPKLVIKVANTLEEREAVFQLGYEIYLSKGYINQNDRELLIQAYDNEKETVILIVMDEQKKIVGSVTILFGESSKLPLASIYQSELNQLKKEGKKIAEISRLVISPDYRNTKEVLILLFDYLSIYAYQVKKYDFLAIQVNPRHKDYYKKLLCFEELGSEKQCPHVKNAPAILLCLSKKRYLQEKCDNKIYANQFKNRTLCPFFSNSEQENLIANYLKNNVKPISAEEKIYFGFMETGYMTAVQE